MVLCCGVVWCNAVMWCCCVLGSVHMCVLTDLGQLFSCGKSEYTGHGTRHDVLEPTLLDAFEGVPIR